MVITVQIVIIVEMVIMVEMVLVEMVTMVKMAIMDKIVIMVAMDNMVIMVMIITVALVVVSISEGGFPTLECFHQVLTVSQPVSAMILSTWSSLLSVNTPRQIKLAL